MKNTMLWAGLAAVVAYVVFYGPKVIREFDFGDVHVKNFDDGTTTIVGPKFDATVNHDTKQVIMVRRGSLADINAFLVAIGE